MCFITLFILLFLPFPFFFFHEILQILPCFSILTKNPPPTLGGGKWPEYISLFNFSSVCPLEDVKRINHRICLAILMSIVCYQIEIRMLFFRDPILLLSFSHAFLVFTNEGMLDLFLNTIPSSFNQRNTNLISFVINYLLSVQNVPFSISYALTRSISIQNFLQMASTLTLL